MKVAKENSRGRFETLFAAVFIVLATWLAYGPSFSGVFLFDDEQSILKNEHLHQVSPIWRILVPPSHLATLAGRPILNLSLVLNWAWGRDSVFGYHLLNFLIHAVAGVLLWEIVRRLLRLSGTDERLQSSGWWLATVVALIWTLHPLQTESVTYIVQRAECMAGMFYFASILAFIVGTESEAGLRRYLYSGSVIACLLAIGTKESGATIPVTILFLDRAFFSTGWKECLRRGGGAFYIALFSCWGVLALLMFSSGQRGGSAGFGLGMTSLEYALSQFGIISRYLRLTFYPHPLALDYGMWLAKTPGEIWPYVVLIVLLVVGTFWLWIRQPRWGFAAFFFWFTLGPTSSVVPLVTQTAAEHRMYLPLAGLIPFVVLGFTWLWSRMMENLRRKGWDVGPLV